MHRLSKLTFAFMFGLMVMTFTLTVTGSAKADDVIDFPCEYLGVEVIKSYQIAAYNRKAGTLLIANNQKAEGEALLYKARQHLAQDTSTFIAMYDGLGCIASHLNNTLQCVEENIKEYQNCIDNFVD